MDQSANQPHDQDLKKGAVEDGPNTLATPMRKTRSTMPACPGRSGNCQDVLGANEDETQG